MEYYMNRYWLNKVCVSRGLKAQQFHSPGQAKRRPGLSTFGLSARGLSCNGPMAFIKFKTTQYAGMFLRQPIQLLQLFTTLVTPQRGDNRNNFSVGPPAQ
jgi:hypothetical protein